MKPMFWEICCGSAADAIAAWKGGARRVELNSDLFHGGLTPTLGALRVVRREAPGLRVMCMVRPREGGFCYTDTEYAVMREDARAFLENGADGIVFGFLHEDGTVDEGRTREMRALIGAREAVFHRAIDVTPDWKAALDTLIDIGVTRVLTSGQRPTVPEGAETLRAMIASAPRGGSRFCPAAASPRRTPPGAASTSAPTASMPRCTAPPGTAARRATRRFISAARCSRPRTAIC